MLQDGDDYEPSLLKYFEPDAVFYLHGFNTISLSRS